MRSGAPTDRLCGREEVRGGGARVGDGAKGREGPRSKGEKMRKA